MKSFFKQWCHSPLLWCSRCCRRQAQQQFDFEQRQQRSDTGQSSNALYYELGSDSEDSTEDTSTPVKNTVDGGKPTH